MTDSVVIRMDMSKPGAWEELCNMRWPNAPLFEKLILETRFAKAVTWEKMPGLMDEFMEKWGKQVKYNCFICPFGLSRTARKNKGNARRFDSVAVRSLAISQYFAAVLIAPDRGNMNSGTVWTFPVIHFENALKGEWTTTNVKFKACQLTYILETSLYAVDGSEIVCIDISARQELYRINVQEKYGIELKDITSLTVSMTGFILIVSPNHGFVVFFQNSVTLTLDLIEHKNAPTDVTKDVFYTTGCVDLDKLVLGRSDGHVERWPVERVDGVFRVTKAETFDFFVEQASDHNLRILKMVAGEPVSYLYCRGRRLMVCSQSNRVSLEILDGTPITMLDEDKGNPIVSVSIFGDFAGVLYTNGILELGRYSGTRAVYTHNNPQTNLPDLNRIPMGEQRVATLADMVIVLSQDGGMYCMNLNDMKT